jgi:hypothetical protein
MSSCCRCCRCRLLNRSLLAQAAHRAKLRFDAVGFCEEVCECDATCTQRALGSQVRGIATLRGGVVQPVPTQKIKHAAMDTKDHRATGSVRYETRTLILLKWWSSAVCGQHCKKKLRRLGTRKRLLSISKTKLRPKRAWTSFCRKACRLMTT